MILIGPAESRGTHLMGLSGGNAAVTSLQNSLKALAQVTGRVAIDPGGADGVVGVRTMSAIIAGFNIIAEKLPSELKTALQIGLVVGGMTNQAKELVTRYASQLDVATKAATLKYATGGGQLPGTNTGTDTTPAPAPSAMPSPTVTFLKTPFGMAAAGVGVLGIGLLLYSVVAK